MRPVLAYGCRQPRDRLSRPAGVGTGLDQSIGVDGFTTSWDIAGSTEQLQTFTAGHSGTLRQVWLTVFQESSLATGGAAVNAPLALL